MMNTYRKNLSHMGDSILTSVTTVGNTVVGILFDKTGAEIREAILARIVMIDLAIAEQRLKIEPVKNFLKEKEEFLLTIKEVEDQRELQRDDLCRPFEDQLESLRKKYCKQADEIHTKRTEASNTFDRETKKTLNDMVGQFREGWREWNDVLTEQLRETKLGRWEIEAPYRCSSSISSHSLSTQNSAPRPPLCSSSSKSCSSNTPRVPSDYVLTSRVNATVQVSDELARVIEVCRKTFRIYRDKIEEYEIEKRSLQVMARNIDPDRSYKLTLNQLSAFGFEDMQIPVEE